MARICHRVLNRRILVAGGLAALLSFPAEAVENITVHVAGNTDSPLEGSMALKTASGIFAKIGVELNWRRGRPRPSASGSEIVVELTQDTPPDLRPGALAFSRPFGGGEIRVFYDRVKDLMPPPRSHALLGHVIAHELVHVLERTDRHTADGLLSARWKVADYHEMIFAQLTISPVDEMLVRRGIEDRKRLARK